YSYNERSMLSLGTVDPDVEIGDEGTRVWGEEHGGTKKTTVERHKQIGGRAVVSPGPYAKGVREQYDGGRRRAGQGSGRQAAPRESRRTSNEGKVAAAAFPFSCPQGRSADDDRTRRAPRHSNSRTPRR